MIEVWKVVVILLPLFVWSILDSRKDKKEIEELEANLDVTDALRRRYGVDLITKEVALDSQTRTVADLKEKIKDLEPERDRFYTDHIALEYLALDTDTLDHTSEYSIEQEGLDYPIIRGTSFSDMPYEFAVNVGGKLCKATILDKKYLRTVNDVDKWTFKAVLMKLPDDVVQRIEELFQ